MKGIENPSGGSQEPSPASDGNTQDRRAFLAGALRGAFAALAGSAILKPTTADASVEIPGAAPPRVNKDKKPEACKAGKKQKPQKGKENGQQQLPKGKQQPEACKGGAQNPQPKQQKPQPAPAPEEKKNPKPPRQPEACK